MKGLLRTGVVALLLAVLVFAGRSASEPKKPQPPRSRIAVVNLSTVIKNYEKYKAFQEEVKQEIQRFQKLDVNLREQIEELTRQVANSEIEGKKDEIEAKLRKVKRDLDENQVEAKKVLGKKSDEQMVTLYKEVREACARYAKGNDIEMVMHYNDAPAGTPEFDNPTNVARKMQAGAFMPIYITQGLDISEEIVTLLNNAWRDGQPRRPDAD